MQQGTLEELFSITLRIEKEARIFYERLSEMFHELREAREFFDHMAMDEVRHAKGIELLMTSAGKDSLRSFAPLHSIGLAKSFLNFSADEAIKSIKTLHDAYKATVKLEFSEANKLHELLFELNADKETMDDITTALKKHQEHVIRFKNSGVDMSYRV